MGVSHRVLCPVRAVPAEGRARARPELEVRTERPMWQKCYVPGGPRVARGPEPEQASPRRARQLKALDFTLRSISPRVQLFKEIKKCGNW